MKAEGIRKREFKDLLIFEPYECLNGTFVGTGRKQ